MPSLTGMNCTQATQALTTAHLKGGCIAGQYSDTVPNGQAISWSYDGAQSPQTAPYGSIIDIVPSLGHGPVAVPTTISQTDNYQDALVLLQAVGLKDITASYVETLRRWRENLAGERSELERLGYDERFHRLWTLYLSYCEGGFAERRICDVQLLLAKPQWAAQLNGHVHSATAAAVHSSI